MTTTLSNPPTTASPLSLESVRQRRSLRRRLDGARLGIFKSLADFDYDWREELDRQLLEELMTVSFLSDAANVIIVGSNGLGKTMLAKNILHQAILRGHTARFTLASDMLHALTTTRRGMSENTINLALRRMGYTNEEMTGHGFRSMA